jgi:hypothetical protein
MSAYTFDLKGVFNIGQINSRTGRRKPVRQAKSPGVGDVALR